MIRFGEEVSTNLDAALRREWLETNGIGGFASGTINGCNSRRYHGLLVYKGNWRKRYGTPPSSSMARGFEGASRRCWRGAYFGNLQGRRAASSSWLHRQAWSV